MTTEGQARSTASKEAAKPESFAARVNPWIALAGSVGTLLLAAFYFFNPIGEVDLTVRIDQEVQAKLPSSAAQDLKLVYKGDEINHASVITVEIVNSGRRRIGTDDRRWTLDLRSADGSAVVPLGNPRPTPSSRQVSVTKGPKRDVAVVTFGLFNRGDKVVLDLLLINPKDDTHLPVIAETNVPDLGEPATGRRNVRERLRDAFTPPLFALSFLVLGVLLAWERIQLQRRNEALATVHTLPGGLLLVTAAATLLTIVGANGIAWIAELILARS